VEPPAHVPAGHVVDFDYLRPQGLEEQNIYHALKPLHSCPDIFWTCRNGGHWVVTRSEDVRWVRNEHTIFSHEEFGIPRGSMNVPMPPVTVDPPYHARYRAVLNPAFTPAVATRLIEGMATRGGCEFVTDFARIMPVDVFLKILNLPLARRDEFVEWAVGYTSAKDQETKDRCAGLIAEFLAGQIDARASHPGDDLLSRIAGWRKNARYNNEAEVLGMAMVSFIGGLDTLSNLLSFTALHLAGDAAARGRLLREPGLIPRAAEEFIRRHGLTMTGRLIRHDVTRKSVTMKQGEMVLVVDPLAGLDERTYPDPFAVDFDRGCTAHDSFGNAAHRCIGEHLARMELIVFLEEWLKRIPDFHVDPDLPPITYSGPVIGVSRLQLSWGQDSEVEKP
jgi:cytochrome P450